MLQVTGIPISTYSLAHPHLKWGYSYLNLKEIFGIFTLFFQAVVYLFNKVFFSLNNIIIYTHCNGYAILSDMYYVVL